MIGAIRLMRRRDDIDAAQFRQHRLDIHGPLVCLMTGPRHYAQGHVIATLTPAARDMAIDGFAELAFDSVMARAAAYGSPALAACDRDSPLFIGQVSRLITEAEIVVPCDQAPDLIKLVVLFPSSAAADRATFEPVGPRALTWHRVLEQGRAPNSSVPELHCPVAALAELWVNGPATAAAFDTFQAGVFSVIEHRFC